MTGIYKITSPSGKNYIGQSINIEKRFKQYFFLNCKQQYKIYNSLKKYGVENHIFQVIEECNIELLNERERYWQDFYNVIKNGLNLKLTKTTDKNGFFSSEIKNKISLANKGKTRTEEQIKKMSELSKGRTPYNKGLKMSEEQKNKLSKIHSGKKRKPLTLETKNKISFSQKNKPRKKHTDESKNKISLALKGRNGNPTRSLLLIDLDTGVFYDSIREYCNLYNLKHPTIYNILKGKYKNEKFNNLKLI